MKERRLLIALLVLASVSLFLGAMPIRGEEEIYDSVIRLHVLANSDSEEDQAVKLKVRDAVLAVTQPLLRDCHDRESAERLLRANEESLRQTAIDTLQKEGYDHEVSVTLDVESYPERSYDSFCFPSGEYLSLRVCIGDAEGKNWWCCLFPPLCLGASTVPSEEAEDAFISVGLTPPQYKIITETDRPVYKIRFKLLELFW